MADQAYVKLEPLGPGGGGLTRRPPYPRDGLETEPPVHSSHLYVNDEEGGIKIGAWECTPQTSKMQPFAVTEFMVLLEGRVTMLERDGRRTTVEAGEAFVVPKGVVCQWRQSEPVRKYFAIQAGKPGAACRDGDAVTKANAMGEPAAEAADAGLPLSHGAVIYADAARSYLLVRWDRPGRASGAFIPDAYHLLHVEAGSLTLSAAQEGERTFDAGDTVLVNPGKALTWASSDELRLLSCSIKRLS